jgi:steroid delta-isomerase-like uncharacterized protein
VPTPWEITNEFYDAFADHDLRRLLDLYSPDAVMVMPAGMVEGREQIASCYEDFLRAFPDGSMTPWCTLHCSDPVVTEWTLTGTHMGLLMVDGSKVEGTGRRIAVRGCSAAQIENGKIVTHRYYFDQLELYSQLGFDRVTGSVA